MHVISKKINQKKYIAQRFSSRLISQIKTRRTKHLAKGFFSLQKVARTLDSHNMPVSDTNKCVYCPTMLLDLYLSVDIQKSQPNIISRKKDNNNSCTLQTL